jgi:hypothetical protein
MKTIFWIIITALLWIGTALLIEVDYRMFGGRVINTFSPIQWFIFLILIWGVVSALNWYIILAKRNLFHLPLKEFIEEISLINFILCAVPITNLIVLFVNIMHLMYAIILPDEVRRRELMEEFNKKSE